MNRREEPDVREPILTTRAEQVSSAVLGPQTVGAPSPVPAKASVISDHSGSRGDDPPLTEAQVGDVYTRCVEGIKAEIRHVLQSAKFARYLGWIGARIAARLVPGVGGVA